VHLKQTPAIPLFLLTVFAVWLSCASPLKLPRVSPSPNVEVMREALLLAWGPGKSIVNGKVLLCWKIGGFRLIPFLGNITLN
jgi:hypothetical protein